VIARFFIRRPIFATVLSAIVTLVGALALFYLPVAQYPQIRPPSVVVSISYPGANARTVADTVAAPIEQEVNGVPGMLYMSSQMGNDGTYSLTVTFDIDVDLKTALVMVQNRVTLAMQQLPTEVQNQGITIRKRSPEMLMIVNVFSPDERYDALYLSNYATIHLKDELLRLEGVSDINIQGQRDYSIRAWLDPQKLASRNMTAMDVADAIRRQNLDAPAGQLGQPPSPEGQISQLPIDALGRLTEPEQFGDIIVKVGGGTPQPQANAAARPGRGGIRFSGPAGTLTLPGLGGSAGGAGGGMTTPAPTTTPSSFDSSADSGDTSTSAARTPSTGTPLFTTDTSAAGGVAASGSNTTAGGGTATGPASGMTGPPATQSAGAGSDPLIDGGRGAGGTLASGTMGRGPGRPSVGIVRLRDVARVELGALNYNQSGTFDGRPSIGLAVYQLPGTNALEVAARVYRRLEELKQRFPEGVDYQVAYDTTPYVWESIRNVVRALLDSVILVALVVLVFLQNWRSVIIPLAAVPVAIVGTFGVMAALGYSINNISLFGLLLAIGIVVDDAIVVVENVDRWIERGLPPAEATARAMDEVTGPIIAVAVVLCAVFVPCAFVSGITGQFFRQFAVTIAVSTILSTLNSLTLSPALSALLLRPRGGRRDPFTWVMDFALGWFFWLFNKCFGLGTAAYGWAVGRLVRLSTLVLVGYLGLLVLTYFVTARAPTGFIPQQDQGRLIVNVQLPDSASLERTRAAVAEIDAIARETPGVSHTIANPGVSFLAQSNSPNVASMFIILDPFDGRRTSDLRDTAIMARLRREWFRRVKDAQVTVFGSSPVPGLGTAGGFKFMVQDRGGLGLADLQEQTEKLVRELQAHPGLTGVTTQFRSNTPQLYLEIDRTKAAALGVSLDDVNRTLDIYLGSLYVTSYNQFGRHWQVTIQAEGTFRDRPDDINTLQVRNKWGQMVLLGTLVNVREVGGPLSVTRYNLSTSAAVNGNIRTGFSTGEAIRAVNEAAARSLPRTMKIEWTELMFMQIRAGDTTLTVFALSVVSVFLALAALYESWSLPLAVILVVPTCLLCSVAGVLGSHRDVNIFVQIGLVVLVGLACKNAILIVEFAKQLHETGVPLARATQEASQQRLRPILMTSFAFIMGVLPLVVAVGAGAEMRRSLGTAVFSGMLGVTLFGVFLTPVFFYVLRALDESPLLAGAIVRRTLVVLMGTLLGLEAGYLLGHLGFVRPAFAMPLGAGAGVAIVLLALAVRYAVTARRPRLVSPGHQGGRPT
jgi:multidrug efflux pump